MQSRGDWQEDLFVASPLRELVPDDHILKRVDAVLDLSWLHEAVRGCYCQDNGRPSIDPERVLRLMLAGFFQGIVHDRKLMREAQVNLAIRWFAGYRLDEVLPERSSLTRIRQRWGAPLFRSIFERTVAQCMEAGLVSADTVHIDATLIRADVSWDSLTTRHAEQVVEVNDEKAASDGDDEPPTGRRGRPRKKKIKPQKYSPTDPDATMSTSCKQYHLEPTYKQHTAVEDKNGVIVDVSVTTGQANEGKQLIEQVERIEATLNDHVACVTCDAGYAHGANYATLEQRGTDAVIPPPRIAPRKKGTQRIPARRFKYDEHHDRITCPAGSHLHRKSCTPSTNGRYYRARSSDCKNCPLRERCFSAKAVSRTILIGEGYTALLRARRRKEKGWDESTREKYKRHRWQVEGVHGRSKTQHGLSRAIGRGLTNVTIQSYLTAAVMNLKKLAKKHPATKDQYRLTQACTRLTTQFYALWTSIRQHHKINTPKGYAPPPKQLFTN
ncbi:IS1182 family transposase [Candidatus Wolfebacteria bacterium]|nr:IS1182 family transposase [Candidatus Wolfebacteria bacterium]